MNRRLLTDYLGLLAVLVVLVLIFGATSKRFLSHDTLSIIANQVPDLTVIAIGMTFVLVIAGIDLSVGSVMALSGSVLGVAMVDWGWGLPTAVPLAIGAGLVCGLLNGLVAAVWTIPSFIVTLGMLEIARGTAYLVTNSQTKYIGARVERIGEPIAWLGLSIAFLISVAAVLLGQLVLRQTVFGRFMIAIGNNEAALRMSGINPKPTKIAVFALSGALAGLGGVFHASRLSSADPNAGVGLELSAIAAVVIGGTSLMGGRGSVVASFFGVLIIAVLQTGLASIGAQEPAKRVITGSVIVLAVLIDAYRNRVSGARTVPPLHEQRKVVAAD